MHFRHSGEIWRDFPALVPAVLYDGITSHTEVEARVDRFTAVAKARLADGPEGELPEIQAWRRAFAQMGLKPTQYPVGRAPHSQRAPLHVRRVSRVTPAQLRQPSYARVASGSDPPRISRACSVSWVGFGWPARPRLRPGTTAPRWYAAIAALAASSPTGP